VAASGRIEGPEPHRAHVPRAPTPSRAGAGDRRSRGRPAGGARGRWGRWKRGREFREGRGREVGARGRWGSFDSDYLQRDYYALAVSKQTIILHD